MFLVERGNHIPTVAVVQHLLNKRLRIALRVDGRFGQQTFHAVQDFQRREGTHPDGIVGPATWHRLSADRNLAVLDHVDAADDYHDAGRYRGYEVDLLRTGASPSVSYYQSAGIEGVAQRIRRAAGGNGRVILLRFHGHGGPGSMGLTLGRGGVEHIHADSISLHTIDWVQVMTHFGPLHRIFSPFGSVELHGCNVAGDVYQNGRRIQRNGTGVGLYLLQRLSHLLGVPVTASTNAQYSHGAAILRFEGHTLTVCPDGSSNIEAWARGKSLFVGT